MLRIDCFGFFLIVSKKIRDKNTMFFLVTIERKISLIAEENSVWCIAHGLEGSVLKGVGLSTDGESCSLSKFATMSRNRSPNVEHVGNSPNSGHPPHFEEHQQYFDLCIIATNVAIMHRPYNISNRSSVLPTPTLTLLKHICRTSAMLLTVRQISPL